MHVRLHLACSNLDHHSGTSTVPVKLPGLAITVDRRHLHLARPLWASHYVPWEGPKAPTASVNDMTLERDERNEATA